VAWEGGAKYFAYPCEGWRVILRGHLHVSPRIHLYPHLGPSKCSSLTCSGCFCQVVDPFSGFTAPVCSTNTSGVRVVFPPCEPGLTLHLSTLVDGIGSSGIHVSVALLSLVEIESDCPTPPPDTYRL